MVGIAPEGQVRLSVSHSVIGGSENYKNFPLDLTIAKLKDKLYTIVGTEPQFQKLQLKSKGEIIANMEDNSSLLSSFNPQSGQEIYVIDADPNNTVADLQDTSKAPKYEMTDSEYEKRDNTYKKKWKENQEVDEMKIGSPCEILPDEKNGPRKGTVMYCGPLQGVKGNWVGVKLDEPTGKNDGSVNGVQYFVCLSNHGVFVRSNKVQLRLTEVTNP